VDPAATEEVIPRPAATIIALRRRRAPFEVLLVRRAREASFMGGAHVFPGGTLDPEDHAPATAALVRWSGDPVEVPWRAAALRELAEEAGLLVTPGGIVDHDGAPVYPTLAATGRRLDGDALVYLSNWVTPRGLPRRFDARFYLLEVPPDAVARSDGTEVFDPVWVTPREALDHAGSGRWQIEVPTRAQLEMLADAPGLDRALDTARGTFPTRIEPRLTRDPAGAWMVLLPGQAGFDEAGG
jgi:8-oxo-dGTP pyrophosphatase MutT (NUDIX family)